MYVVPYRPVDDAKVRRDIRVRMAARQRVASQSAFPMGPPNHPLLPVALHEAGHCVAAFIDRAPIKLVLLKGNTERSGGAMRLLNADDLSCAILLAGLAAEIVVLGYGEREYSATDLYQARRIARPIVADVEGFIERKLNQTIAMLEAHRDTLLDLAQELVEKRTLSGDEVNRILNEALVDNH